MATESRKAGERSPNFPFIPLQTALERAAQFYEKEKRGSAPFAVVAEHWHYSPSSSGALQTAAALKSYGLMADEGSGASRKLKLTDLALHILLDTRPESADRDQYKRQAALTPAVAAEIYQKWNGELPSEATLNHHLVLGRGFNQSTSLRAVQIMMLNEVFTKSSAGDTESHYDEMPINSEVIQKGPEVELQYEPGRPAPILVRKAQTPAPERIKSKDFEIVIQFSNEPTPKALNFLKRYIELRIEELETDGGETKNKDKQGQGEEKSSAAK